MATPSGEACSETAMAALEQGDVTQAAMWFERAARAFVAEQNPDRAQSSLSNLGYARKLLGDYAGALEAADEAVRALVPNKPARERGLVLFNRAGVLDRLGDPRARAGWIEAGACFAEQPLMVLVCEAHAAGAAFASSDPDALAVARAALAGLGAHATAALTAGILGAVGDSAGARGIPFLAQSVWLMCARPDAFNTSNVPFLAMLAQRLGLTHALSAPLCGLGFVLVATQQGKPDHDVLLSQVLDFVRRTAAAREIQPDALVDEIRSNESRLRALPDEIRALVPQDQWLLA